MITFVYFDLGGVVEKDFSESKKWDELMKELKIDIAYKDVFTDFWRDGERENCTTRDIETLLPFMAKRFGSRTPNNYSLLDGFVKRFERNESIWPILEVIHKTARIGLLTNQYREMLSAVWKRNILPPITWDVIIDSTEVGFIKPDKEMFDFAQEKAQAEKEKILLVDNSYINTDAAEKFGWQTFFYDSSNYERSSQELLEFWENLN